MLLHSLQAKTRNDGRRGRGGTLYLRSFQYLLSSHYTCSCLKRSLLRLRVLKGCLSFSSAARGHMNSESGNLIGDFEDGTYVIAGSHGVDDLITTQEGNGGRKCCLPSPTIVFILHPRR